MKVLFYSNDGKLGDAILHTALVEGIKSQQADAEIYCITAGSTTAFWQRDPRITQCWPVHKLSFRQIIRLGLQLRKLKIDYLFAWNPIKAEKMRLLTWLIRPKFGVKIIVVKPEQHASIKEQQALQLLGLSTEKTDYAIWPPQTHYQFAQPSIFLNAFASTPARSLTDDEIIDFMQLIQQQLPQTKLYLACTDAHEAKLKAVITQLAAPMDVEVVNCEHNFDKLFSLCQQVSVVITPDTAITHLASAYNKPVAVLFEKENQLLKTNWAPKSEQALVMDYFTASEEQKQQVRREVVEWVREVSLNKISTS